MWYGRPAHCTNGCQVDSFMKILLLVLMIAQIPFIYLEWSGISPAWNIFALGFFLSRLLTEYQND